MPRVSIASCQLPAVKICKNANCGNVAISFDGFCKNHAPYRGLKGYNSRPKASVRWSNPIGIELELFHPDGSSKITPVARFVCSDASLPYGGGEIKLVQDATKIANVAADTAQRAGFAGAKVNKRCGFHIHMGLPSGMRPQLHNIYDVSGAYTRLYMLAKHFEEYFFDIVPRSRRSNTYCSTIKSMSYLNHHYSWLSFSARVPTCELRIHGGTVNPWKVKGWTEVAVEFRKLVNDAINDGSEWKQAVDGSKKFSDHMPAGTLGSKYLIAREKANGSLAEFGF